MSRSTEVHPQTEALARMVHAAWRDGMLAQGRNVAPDRMRWETLSKEDQTLDRCIAEQMALVLATQNLPFLPASYTLATFSHDELRLFAQAGQARGQSLARADQQSGVLMLGLGYGMTQLLKECQAQAEELARLKEPCAEVWMHPNGYAELMAFRGRLTENDLTSLKRDLQDNAPGAGELAERLYVVPIERDFEHPEGDTKSAYLVWDRFVAVPLQSEAGDQA